MHSNVWGPCGIPYIDDYRWFVSYMVYLMHNNNEVFSCFRSFYKMLENQFNVKIKILRSDNGMEYSKHLFQNYLDDHGIYMWIFRHKIVPERKNQDPRQVAKFLLFATNVHTNYPNIVLSGTYERLCKQLSTWLEKLISSYDNTMFPKLFGCTRLVHDHKRTNDKLHTYAINSMFIGYSFSKRT